jgi:hypothetical protein
LIRSAYHSPTRPRTGCRAAGRGGLSTPGRWGHHPPGLPRLSPGQRQVLHACRALESAIVARKSPFNSRGGCAAQHVQRRGELVGALRGCASRRRRTSPSRRATTGTRWTVDQSAGKRDIASPCAPGVHRPRLRSWRSAASISAYDSKDVAKASAERRGRTAAELVRRARTGQRARRRRSTQSSPHPADHCACRHRARHGDWRGRVFAHRPNGALEDPQGGEGVERPVKRRLTRRRSDRGESRHGLPRSVMTTQPSSGATPRK